MKYLKLFENFEDYNPYDLMVMFPDEMFKMLIEEIDKDEPNLNLVSDLIVLGSNIDSHDEEDDGKTPLHKTIENGQIKITKMLIDAGVDLNVQDEYGVTPLHWAVLHGDEDVLRMLIELKADLNKPDSAGATPLYSAVTQGEETLIKLLLDAGADVDNPGNPGTWSPLFFAAWDYNPELTKLLLQHGADPNLPDSFGETPLHQVSSRSEEISELGIEYVLLVAQMLIDAGARKDIRDNKGRLPYDLTTNEELKKLLKP